MQTNQGEETTPDDQPPILGRWSRLYTLVILGNVLWLGLAYLFTRIYA
ncbi:MAG: hypothetical protein AAGF87_15470 [Bacteroidota bacterium]